MCRQAVRYVAAGVLQRQPLPAQRGGRRALQVPCHACTLAPCLLEFVYGSQEQGGLALRANLGCFAGLQRTRLLKG